MNTDKNESPFGPVIYSYTRAQAVADGVQVEVTKTAQEAGIKFPMFLTAPFMTPTLPCPLVAVRIHHPLRQFWAVTQPPSPPLNIWPEILGKYTL